MTLQELINRMKGTLGDDDFFLKPTEEDVALLESMLPEERKGECFCPEGGEFKLTSTKPEGGPIEDDRPEWWTVDGFYRDIGERCPGCGGLLCPKNICRRNPDSKRVDILARLCEIEADDDTVAGRDGRIELEVYPPLGDEEATRIFPGLGGRWTVRGNLKHESYTDKGKGADLRAAIDKAGSNLAQQGNDQP